MTPATTPSTTVFAPAEPARRETIMSLEGLSKRFAVRRGWRETLRHPAGAEWARVVHEVRMEIGVGECFGLLGPNGAGKTTLFKMLATLILPDSGTASIAGFDLVRDAADVRRMLTPVIADERSLYWRISARENLRLFASLHGMHGAVARRRVEELLEVVQLADSPKMVGTFSSGMKQRLLIARALIARPRILLLDEPTRSLDPVSARTLRAFLRDEIAGRQGCTVFLATHSTEEALELCHRVAVLDRGHVRAIGAAPTLAAEIGEGRHRFWLRGDTRQALGILASRSMVRNIGDPSIDADGWVCVEMEIDGGMAAVASVVSMLTRARVSVGRLEPVHLGLADLIERIIARAPGAGGRADA